MISDLRRPDYRRVMNAVADLHRQFAIDSPPVNPVPIAEELGIRVKFVTFSGEYVKVSGFFDVDENAIFVNSEEYPLRQTFTVAHELGHARLHREWAASAEYKVLLRDTSATPEIDPFESEANAFAAHLLVPRFILERYIHLPVHKLSELFAVSVPTIRNRLSREYGYY